MYLETLILKYAIVENLPRNLNGENKPRKLTDIQRQMVEEIEKQQKRTMTF
jgi:hypothetical protein